MSDVVNIYNDITIYYILKNLTVSADTLDTPWIRPCFSQSLVLWCAVGACDMKRSMAILKD